MDDKLALTFLPLIKKIASTFYNCEYEDLIQAGYMGLQDAYRHYIKNEHTKFSTFAYQYIYGEIYRTANSNIIKNNNRELLKLLKLINKTKILLTQKLNKEPSISEIANYLETDINTIYYALSETNTILSLDKEIESDSNLYNKISFNVDNDTKIDIKDSLKQLNKEEHQVIKHLFYDSLTQEETAKIMNISQVKVSRYKARSLNKMHEYLKVA